MEQLVMNIAIPLAKQYGMKKALEIAYERLGIAASKQSPIDVLTGGGINQAFSPSNLTNMIKRQGVKLGFNTLMKGTGSSLLPFAGILGLATLGNKYRKQLTGYDTQAAYEAAREQRIANKRLDKITDRIVGGKSYGNYEDALLDSSAGAVEIDGTIYSGADYQGETQSKSKSEDKSKGGIGTASFGKSFHGNGGGNGGNASPGSAGPGGSDEMGSFRRGGIANL
tara:strand:- start:41 stop:715 length:675 start_codon:yes stop_codon:yes gene_type:complete